MNDAASRESLALAREARDDNVMWEWNITVYRRVGQLRYRDSVIDGHVRLLQTSMDDYCSIVDFCSDFNP